MKTIYFETENTCIWYDQSQHLGSAIWSGALTSAQFREAFLKCTELMVSKRLKYWLADNRAMKMMHQEDLEWIALMAPTLLNSGLLKMATLISEDIFHHMAIIALFDQANGQLTFQNQYFKQEAEALKWLGCTAPALENTAETLT